MIGIVVVSHSAALAEAAIEFALLMAPHDKPSIEAAAGAGSAGFGTSASEIAAAIGRAATAEGVLVLVDLGSAVINAEMAVDLLGETPYTVMVSEAAFVEGLTAAIAAAAAGATLDEVDLEARKAGATKGEPLVRSRTLPSAWTGWDDASTVTGTSLVGGDHGLHARPAAKLVERLRSVDSLVRIRNVSTAGPFVSASSITELMTIGAATGDVIAIEACGSEPQRAIDVVIDLLGGTTSGSFSEPDSKLTGVSPGVGCGLGTRSRRIQPAWSKADYEVGDVDAELERLRLARQAVAAELAGLRTRTGRLLGDAEASIFEIWRGVLEDRALLDPIESEIGNGTSALRAWLSGLAGLITRIGDLSDPYQRQRSTDLVYIRDRVAAQLADLVEPAAEPVEGVLLTDELSAAEVAELDPTVCVGIVAARGTATSHAAIVARSLGIPAVVGATPALLDGLANRLVLVVGDDGVVVADPSEDWTDQARRSPGPLIDVGDFEPAASPGGPSVAVRANLSLAVQAVDVEASGSDGVGLLRSEIVFTRHREAPTIDEHAALYHSISERLGGRPLTVRTFDAAGDKPLWFLGGGLPTGPRGLALTLAYPDVLLAQLRGIVRAAGSAPMRVLFPHVNRAAELASAIDLLAAAVRLEAGGQAEFDAGGGRSAIEIGAMIEGPAAAIDLERIISNVDFLSLGTNDLAAAMTGIDRQLKLGRHEPALLDPAVLQLIRFVCDVSGSIPVAVCGEMANEPLATPVLIGLGVTELSVRPAQVPAIKREVRRWQWPSCVALAAAALEQPGPAEVRQLLSDATPDAPTGATPIRSTKERP